MSRRFLTCGNPAHAAVAGWDPPLQTYFLQLYEHYGTSRERLLHWYGAEAIGVFPTLDVLRPRLESLTSVTPMELLLLAADRVVNHGFAYADAEGTALAALVLAEHRGDVQAALAALMQRPQNLR